MIRPIVPLILIVLTLGVADAAVDTASPTIVHDGDHIRRQVISSAILGEDRVLWIRLPRGYHDSDARYPVLWILDAEWHFDLVATDVELLSECSYISPHPVPPLIVVGVANADRLRRRR